MRITYEKFEKNTDTEYSLENYRTRDQLMHDYGNNAVVVDAIIADKLRRGGKWAIPHPECPGVEEATLYLAWGGAGKKTVQESGTTTHVQASTAIDTQSAESRENLREILKGARPSGPLQTLQSLAPLTLGSGAAGSNSSSPHKILMQEAEAQASTRMLAERESELEAAQRAREVRKEELEAKRTPEDKKRAELAKLSNVVAGKVRQLQAAGVVIATLPEPTPEAKAMNDLTKMHCVAISGTFTKLKADIDALIALGRRATLPVLDIKLAEYTKTLDDNSGALKQLCSLATPPKDPRGKAGPKGKSKPK